MFGSVLECCELTGVIHVSFLPYLAKSGKVFMDDFVNSHVYGNPEHSTI